MPLEYIKEGSTVPRDREGNRLYCDELEVGEKNFGLSDDDVIDVVGLYDPDSNDDDWEICFRACCVAFCSKPAAKKIDGKYYCKEHAKES